MLFRDAAASHLARRGLGQPVAQAAGRRAQVRAVGDEPLDALLGLGQPALEQRDHLLAPAHARLRPEIERDDLGDLVEREAHALEPVDLGHARQGVLVVVAMAAALAARHEQAQALVVPHRAGRHARPARQLADAHAPRINRHANVNVRMSPPAALALEGLTKRYDNGFLALDGLDLVVPDGAFFGLLGPNGAGKTTLISAVCNLIRVTAGEARIFGHDHGTHAARALIGLAEQDVNLDRFLDVEETLLYHGGYYGMERARARRRADEMMDVFDLRAKAHVRAPMLSGGMRRRLLLARALMHEPPLVILDQPTAGVDFELRLELWAYIRRLHSLGTTILLTTHYLEEAEELCEEIALIRGGRLLARDTAPGLREAFAADSLADVYVKAMAS